MNERERPVTIIVIDDFCNSLLIFLVAIILGTYPCQIINFSPTLGIKRIKPVSRITNPRKTIPMAKKGNETISNVRKLMELIELIIPKPTTISIEPNSVE